MSAHCLEAVMVSRPDDIARVFAIRFAVFGVEQRCPYEEEFDGNDLCASHVLGLVDGEPAGSLRIRYFASFAKLERLAVLPRFRDRSVARLVVGKGIELCRRKGYAMLYAQAQLRLAGFWGQFGFHPLTRNVALVFSDHEYVELVAEVDPHADAITINSDPYVIIRPEGEWDTPGILERSSIRPATNPH